jgi:hypothetical protein
MIARAGEGVHQDCVDEIHFIRMLKGHETAPFKFTLNDGSEVYGFVWEDDLQIAHPPRKNRVFIGPNGPLRGDNHRTAKECRQIRFWSIQQIERLDS